MQLDTAGLTLLCPVSRFCMLQSHASHRKSLHRKNYYHYTCHWQNMSLKHVAQSKELGKRSPNPEILITKDLTTKSCVAWEENSDEHTKACMRTRLRRSSSESLSDPLSAARPSRCTVCDGCADELAAPASLTCHSEARLTSAGKMYSAGKGRVSATRDAS